MVNINAFIADLKTTWLRKIITDNNSPRSIILQSLTHIKTVLNLETNFIAEKKNKFWRDVYLSHKYQQRIRKQKYDNVEPIQFSPIRTSK